MVVTIMDQGQNDIQKFTIDTAGNASDYGDLSLQRLRFTAASGMHHEEFRLSLQTERVQAHLTLLMALTLMVLIAECLVSPTR